MLRTMYILRGLASGSCILNGSDIGQTGQQAWVKRACERGRNHFHLKRCLWIDAGGDHGSDGGFDIQIFNTSNTPYVRKSFYRGSFRVFFRGRMS